MNCLSWYDLYAFCIWDGGFLPSEGEWENATAGGSDQRAFPWGNTALGTNTDLAIYGCYFGGTGSCTDVRNIANVGAVAAGAGRWGQLDLAGSVEEWTRDNPYPVPATGTDRASLSSTGTAMIRGGSFAPPATYLVTANRSSTHYLGLASRDAVTGGRCARAP